MRRFLAILLTGGLLLLGPLALASGASAATIAATTTCSNGVDNTGGLGLICEVTVVNTITASGGSATVTVRECHGAAGDPQAACSTTVTNLTKPVTAVTQCNGSINGGGGTLRCSVQVTNNFVGLSTGATAATVNQCVGSGGGITTGCDPFPATTTGATITQCNGSANGGTLVGPDLHRDRHEVLGPRRQDQPVQRLGQWRWSPGHLLREHREPRGGPRLRSDPPDDSHHGTGRRAPRPDQPRSSSLGSSCSPSSSPGEPHGARSGPAELSG